MYWCKNSALLKGLKYLLTFFRLSETYCVHYQRFYKEETVKGNYIFTSTKLFLDTTQSFKRHLVNTL